MRRRHVIAIGYGDDDELVGNLKSLKTRYTSKDGTYKGAKCDYHQMQLSKSSKGKFTGENEAAQKEIVDKICKDGGATGVYILCHGGRNGMKNPPPDVAAERVAELLKNKISVDKICIGACQAAGAVREGKLNDEAFAKSALTDFCKFLIEKVGKDKIPDNLKICAYNTNITTFDPTSEWIIEKTVDESKSTPLTIVKPDLTEGNIRTAKLNYTQIPPRGNNPLQSMEAIRPKAGNDFYARFVDAYKATVQIIYDNHPKFETARLNHKTFKDALNAKAIADPDIRLMRLVATNRMAKFHEENADAMSLLKSYIRNKIVLIHEGAGKFRLGSLSEYSDTQEVRDTVQVVESRMNDANVPRKVLTFHPDVAAHDGN